MNSAALKNSMVSALVVALAVASVSARASGQDKPNFSGVWIGHTETRGARVTTQFWAAGQPVTITQDESMLTIAYVGIGRSHSPVRLTYNLRGATTTNTGPLGPGPSSIPTPRNTSSASWDGASLVLVSVFESTSATTGVVQRDEYRDRLTMESPTVFRLESSSSRADSVASTARFQRSSGAVRF